MTSPAPGQPHRDDLQDRVAQLQRLVLDDSQVIDELLDGMARVAVQLTDPLASCGITARRDGRPLTVGSSDERATALDETQYDADAGPCLQALSTGGPVEVSDIARDDRWPRYRDRALHAGVASSLSLPLTAEGVTIGALNLYRPGVGLLLPEQRRHAELAAGQTAALTRFAYRQARQAEVGRRLAEQVETRALLDRAIGVLAQQNSCSAAEAEARLRAAAQEPGGVIEAARAVLRTVPARPGGSAPAQ